MCTLGRSIALKNQQIGKDIGKELGIPIGEEKANRDTTSRLFQLGRPIEEIAIAVDVTVETVRKWLEEAGLVTKA